MENQVALPDYEQFKEPLAMGDIFAQSGMFPDIQTKAQAAVKIMAGKELGFTPFEAMASLYMVGGKLALTVKAMSSMIKKSKVYDYAIDELTEEKCVLTFYKGDGNPIGSSSFTIKDAAKAALVNKDNWRNYPRNMLFARALANGARWYCPECISGYYTVEELQDIPTEPVSATVELTKEGEVVNAS